jgi:hypothetical protein
VNYTSFGEGERKVAQSGEPKGYFSMLNINNSWRHSPYCTLPYPTLPSFLHYIRMSAAARPRPAYLLRVTILCIQ